MSNWDLKFHTINFKTHNFFRTRSKEGIVEEASYDFNHGHKKQTKLNKSHSSALLSFKAKAKY